MAFGKVISLFLIEGDPQGRWACELSNWNGKAYRIPRVSLDLCADRKDMAGCGVYFLFGKDDVSGRNLAYIGEAENIYERLKQHAGSSGKDFWTECVVFISKDNRLNKAHIKHMERAIYQSAVCANRYELKNATVPAEASLTEAEYAEMEEFLYNVKLMIGAMGYKIFEPLARLGEGGQASSVLKISAARGAQATGYMTAEGFLVEKDSVVAASVTNSCPDHILKLRKKLFDEGILDSEWKFAEDYVFSSQSTAAGVVMGRSANGLTEWRK